MDKHTDPRDLGPKIPTTWYQSPQWRLEMIQNLRASAQGDNSWVTRKLESYASRCSGIRAPRV